MAKKEGAITAQEENEELSRAQNALKKMKSLEKKKAKKLKKIYINRGYVMSNDADKWLEYNSNIIKA